MLDFLKTADSPSVAILHERLLREVCEIIDNVDQAAGRWDFDGRELSTYRQFEQKMKKALDFPHNYGRNRAALADCLLDLSWFHIKAAYLLFKNADCFLNRGSDEDVAFILWAFDRAGQWWQKPTEYEEDIGLSLELSVRPYYTVFFCSAEDNGFWTRQTEIPVRLIGFQNAGDN